MQTEHGSVTFDEAEALISLRSSSCFYAVAGLDPCCGNASLG